MKLYKAFLSTSCILGTGIMMLSLNSCLSDGEESFILEDYVKEIIRVVGIPGDDQAQNSPEVSYDEVTTTISNPTCTVEQNEDGTNVASINLTGIWDDSNDDWLSLVGTDGNVNGNSTKRAQNVWVDVDDTPKGIDVYNTSEGEGQRIVMADLVFLVDNSGSMSEEADGLATQVISWSEKLAASGLDIRFGCVGYGDSRFSNTSIGGGLNLTTVSFLKEYLDRSSGTYRTQGFEGPDAYTLLSAAESGNYNNGSCYNECGMVALRFADQQYNFRKGANRIYVNFTDEPNQPGGKESWSVEFLNNSLNWNPAQGTVHTVWSESGSYSWRTLWEEDPKKMSEYTGGTSKDVDRYFRSATLDDLPVTGAMQNSYIIRFTNIEDKMDGLPHNVKITVVSEDKAVKAVKSFNVIFGENNAEE